MEQKITISGQIYSVESEVDAPEKFALLAAAMNKYYSIREEYNQKKAEFELAHYRMEQMFGASFDEIGLKKFSDKYMSISYVPPKEGTTTTSKELDMAKLEKHFDDLGLDINEYMKAVTKTTGKRKGYITVK